LSIDETRQTLADLERQLATESAQEIEIATESQRLAYAAATGDESAKKALSKLDERAFAVDRNKRNLGHAINEARRRLGEAEHAEQMAGLAEKADEVKKLAAEFEQLGPEIDADFVSVRGKLERVAWIVDRFHGLGVTHPRGEQIKVMCGLALASHLMSLPIKAERDHLAPRERHTFTELFGGWARGAVNVALRWLNKEAEEAA
jgi:hypothetical protein